MPCTQPTSSKATSNVSFHTARTTMSPPRRASPVKRLHAELTTLKTALATDAGSGVIERLEPVSLEDLFRWEAVVRGKGLSGGYEGGRWLLDIEVPEAYPNAPPKVRFRTKIVGSNVDFEVCFFYRFGCELALGFWGVCFNADGG
jgi:hypothetical protein